MTPDDSCNTVDSHNIWNSRIAMKTVRPKTSLLRVYLIRIANNLINLHQLFLIQVFTRSWLLRFINCFNITVALTKIDNLTVITICSFDRLPFHKKDEWWALHTFWLFKATFLELHFNWIEKCLNYNGMTFCNKSYFKPMMPQPYSDDSSSEQ